MKHIKLSIIGKVQGVWYRGWTVNTAISLGLSGWVRNRRDGSVEAEFYGKEKTVDAMIEKCWTGPEYATVTEITVTELNGMDYEKRPAGDFKKLETA